MSSRSAISTRQSLRWLRRRYFDVDVTPKFRDLLNDNRIDVIAIATPVHTHYDLAVASLRAGKHVLVEKPLAQTLRPSASFDRRGS